MNATQTPHSNIAVCATESLMCSLCECYTRTALWFVVENYHFISSQSEVWWTQLYKNIPKKNIYKYIIYTKNQLSQERKYIYKKIGITLALARKTTCFQLFGNFRIFTESTCIFIQWVHALLFCFLHSWKQYYYIQKSMPAMAAQKKNTLKTMNGSNISVNYTI